MTHALRYWSPTHDISRSPIVLCLDLPQRNVFARLCGMLSHKVRPKYANSWIKRPLKWSANQKANSRDQTMALWRLDCHRAIYHRVKCFLPALSASSSEFRGPLHGIHERIRRRMSHLVPHAPSHNRRASNWYAASGCQRQQYMYSYATATGSVYRSYIRTYVYNRQRWVVAMGWPGIVWANWAWGLFWVLFDQLDDNLSSSEAAHIGMYIYICIFTIPILNCLAYWEIIILVLLVWRLCILN